MAAVNYGIQYGKRMLKAGLAKSGALKKTKRLSPTDDAKYYCQAGIDKEGLEAKYISDYKGYGVFTMQDFKSGDFLLQYCGEKITEDDAKIRIKKNADNKMFFYTYKGKHWCIDAEGTLDHICQFVNDAHDSRSNAVMKMTLVNDNECLCLFAKADIMPGQEVLYNYGDEQNLWWRKEENMLKDQFSFDSDSDPFCLNSTMQSDSSESYVSDSTSFETVYTDPQQEPEIHPGQYPQLQVDPGEFNAQCEGERGGCDGPTTQSTAGIMAEDVEINADAVSSGPSPTTIGNHDDSMEVVTVASPSACASQCVGSSGDADSQIQGAGTCGSTADPDLPATEPETETARRPATEFCGPTMTGSFQESSGQMRDSRSVLYPPPQEATTSPRWTPKPERYCIYCKQVIKGGKLKRHLIRKHKLETEIKGILLEPTSIQNAFFDKKRREGIYEYNIFLMSNGNDPQMRERQPSAEDKLRVCIECKGYFSNKYFFRHKCCTFKPTAMKPKLMLSSKMTKIEQDKEFMDILNRFHDTEVGDICRSNDTIKIIGYRHFNLRRHEEGKADEVRKVVMSEMRELARLYVVFKEISGEKTVEDMLTRACLPDLIEAIERKVKVDEHTEKHGLKLFLDAVILRSVKTLRGHFSESMQDDKRKELKLFQEAYTHKANELYPKARQTCIKNSFAKARRPANLPDEMELRKLKNFIECSIKETAESFDIKQYAWLRTLTVSRLTLFNARRGEESSRMLLSEWEDAMKNTWLPEDQIEKIEDSAEKYIIGQFKLCYLQGKGKKFVPVLVPNDLKESIQILIDQRAAFGIADENHHVFATKSLGHKTSHCSGWHALNEVCLKAGVNIPVTATKMRHRLSTIYASLDMSTEHQKIFLDHMGHESAINKENYQCPQGIKTVQVMGKMLSHIDEGNSLDAGNVFSSPDPLDEQLNAQSPDETDENSGEEDIVDHRGVHLPVKRVQRKAVSVKWSDSDTKSLREHFKEYVYDKKEGNKGSLPSKQKILEYLNQQEPVSLGDIGIKEKYWKTRTKLFNERKTIRALIRTKLKTLSATKHK